MSIHEQIQSKTDADYAFERAVLFGRVVVMKVVPPTAVLRLLVGERKHASR